MAKLKFQPQGDRVLVEAAPAEERTAGGIIIPDTAKEKPQEGRVVEVGPGKQDEDGKRIGMEVKVGDKVMFKKWGGTEVKVEGKEMLLVKEEDVLAIVEE